jgi:hypothetical protein
MGQNPLGNQIVAELLKKLVAFYGNRKFITVFTKARHCPILSQMNLVHSHPVFSRTILTLSRHLRLGLPGDFFLSHSGI